MEVSGIHLKDFEQSSLDSVYEALRNEDLADCVVLATRALKQSNKFMNFEKVEKCNAEALQLAASAKRAFNDGDYQLALLNFNKALMRAPHDSAAMKLSYFSRAELLFKTDQHWYCIKDIATCLTLSCPPNMVKRLEEMKAKSSKYAWLEDMVLSSTVLSSPAELEDFFTFKGPCNPDIPCATSDVEVIMEFGQPKVVAARDIPVGTVVAVETAFTAATHAENQFISCHYCFKMDLNLIPCEGCCYALFCNKSCKDKAMEEGHNVECKIIDIITDDIKLAVKSTLKIRELCGSWDEFITASNDLGTDRMKNSALSEVFGSDKFALLNCHFDIHFIHGILFNRSMRVANIIHFLDTHTSFLPNSPEEKTVAIQAVARVMMHLSLHCLPVPLRYHEFRCTQGKATMHQYNNKGYFPFLGKLANSCTPNSYVAGLRNSAGLIIIAPVKKGAELTFSYIGHWLEIIPSGFYVRARSLYAHYKTVCMDCVICEGYADNIFLSVRLTEAQAKANKKFCEFYSKASKDFPLNVTTFFKETCKILSALGDVPCSMAYPKAFAAFLKCLVHILHMSYRNMIMTPTLK